MSRSSQKVYVPRISVRMVCDSPNYLETASPLLAPNVVTEFVAPMFEGMDREAVIVISVNSNNVPLYYEQIAIGSSNACLIDMKSIFKHILLTGGTGVMLVHNHPSQRAVPSIEDDMVTVKLKNAAEILDIILVDHIIYCSPSVYYSYAENGWNDI